MDLAPFRPDQGEQISGTPTNCFMLGPSRYGPRPTLSAIAGAGALAAAPQGAFGGYLPDGTFKGFCATGTKVYTLGADYTFTALSPTFTVPSGDDECMTQMGVKMLASNLTDGIYDYDMSSPAGLNAVSGSPKARYMFAANNQLIALGDTSSNLARLRTSAFGDYTKWTGGKGASVQDMIDGGSFTGGGDIGNGRASLLQQRSVRAMIFGAAGGSNFALQTFGGDVGCVHPRAQVTYNGKTWFVGLAGFWEFDGFNPPANIGAGKVNKWFLARCADLKKVYASVDPTNTLVRFRYKANGVGSDSIFQDILDYNWVTQEFIPGLEVTSAIFRMASPGYVLDTISSAFGVLNAWSAYPLDSDFWKGGNQALAGLDGSYKFGFFNGSSAAATIETATDGDGRTYLVNETEPLTDDSAATVQLGVKDRLTDAVTYKTASTMRTSGRVPVRGRGKWQRYRINHASGAAWTGDSGIEITDKRAGGPR